MSPLSSPSTNTNKDALARPSSTKSRREVLLHRKKHSGWRHTATTMDRGASRRKLIERIARRRVAKAEAEKKNDKDDDGDEGNGDGEARCMLRLCRNRDESRQWFITEVSREVIEDDRAPASSYGSVNVQSDE
ncbi:hypothetical protein GGU10DRAFT_382004 [Lentinula aff. detonsa]|uniref:Uncharacterized protein n=1 Tax=Lentinula aff. detonsa TaxID=2804958 RepID=A0AA38KKM4_9AGAR|nr:hypothetical protein GGU10DRAFT_382004 [Lentinula aff. detonsa]